MPFQSSQMGCQGLPKRAARIQWNLLPGSVCYAECLSLIRLLGVVYKGLLGNAKLATKVP